MKSNLSIKSNLMIDDDIHKPEYRFLPGDFVGQIYPGKIHVERIERELTRLQLIEFEQYLVCCVCKKSCAGTCSI